MNYKEITEKIRYDQERAEAVQKLILLGTITNPKEKFNAVIEDRTDNKFLEAAIAGNADYIITRDEKHILPLKEFRGIKIVTPEEFLKIYNKHISSKPPLTK